MMMCKQLFDLTRYHVDSSEWSVFRVRGFLLQDSVIARQEEELSSLKAQIVSLQQQLMISADRTIDLTLKSSGQHSVL